jgi:preprotein translocase subunit SecF
MRFLNGSTTIRFMERRVIGMVISVMLIVASISVIALRGLNMGIDFTGGTLIELQTSKVLQLDDVRHILSDNSFGDATVQNFGSTRDILIRVAGKQEDKEASDLGHRVLQVIRTLDSNVIDKRIETVSDQVGDDLSEDGGLAVLFALIAILVYVWLRFEWRFSLGAIAALVHDVIITLGMFALFQLDFDLPVLAAILAVIGYSLNDTIVVFDRIRENFRKMRKGTSADVINSSLNQTLPRTLMTSFTTLLVLLALFFLGGSIIHSFASALIIGIVVGTYSSIYVASAIALTLGVSKADLMPPVKEKADYQEDDEP